jgi:hypothetical protein
VRTTSGRPLFDDQDEHTTDLKNHTTPSDDDGESCELGHGHPSRLHSASVLLALSGLTPYCNFILAPKRANGLRRDLPVGMGERCVRGNIL